MSESIENTAAVNVNATEQHATVDHAERAQEQEQQAQQEQETAEMEQAQPTAQDTADGIADAKKCMAHMLSAFRRGAKAFALSRVEAGYWARAYTINMRANGMSRDGAVGNVKAALAVEAESVADADPNTLMHIYGLVAWYAAKHEPFGKGNLPKKNEPDWCSLGYSKLVSLMGLVVRDGETENWILRPGLSESDARLLVTWAIGSEGARPIRKDIDAKVLSLINPEKAAEKAAEKAKTAESSNGGAAPAPTTEKPATVEGAESEQDEEEQDAPAETVQSNLLKVAQAGTSKDVAGMAAELVHGAQDATAVVKELSRILDWSPDMAVALANGIMDVAPKSARALYLALRNLMSKADKSESKDGAAETNGATVSA